MYIFLASYADEMRNVYQVVQWISIPCAVVAIAVGAMLIITRGEKGMKEGLTIIISSIIAMGAILLLPTAIDTGVDLGEKYAWDPMNPETIGNSADLTGGEFNESEAINYYAENPTFDVSTGQPATQEEKEKAGVEENGDVNTGTKIYESTLKPYFDSRGLVFTRQLNWDNLTYTVTEDGYLTAMWTYDSDTPATSDKFYNKNIQSGKLSSVQQIAEFAELVAIEKEWCAYYRNFKDSKGTIEMIQKQYAEQFGGNIVFHYDITNIVNYDGSMSFRWYPVSNSRNGWLSSNAGLVKNFSFQELDDLLDTISLCKYGDGTYPEACHDIFTENGKSNTKKNKPKKD